MRAIFISYRREDAEGQAGRLFNDLVRHFGEQSVFMDVAGIEPGRDFRKAIDEHVASCGVLLAVMGKRWLDAKDGEGRRRLDDPQDFVRLETASALKRDIPVVPVLVQGARMPLAGELPPDLAELAFRNALELTHARWDSDVAVLLEALERHVAPSKGAQERGAGAGSSRWKWMVGGAATLSVAAVVGYLKVATGEVEPKPDTLAVGTAPLNPQKPVVEPPSEPKEPAGEEQRETAATQHTSNGPANPASGAAQPSAPASAADARGPSEQPESKRRLERQRARQQRLDETAESVSSAAAPRGSAALLAPRLAGTWSWGQPCSEGPRVRLLKDRLVFTDANSRVVHLIQSDDGSMLRTKVVAPPEKVDDVYEFRLNGEQLVLYEPKTKAKNLWLRCDG